MSTKIYGGLKIELQDKSYEALVRWFTDVARPHVKQKLDEHVGRHKLFGDVDDLTSSKYMELFDGLQSAKAKNLGHPFDFGLEVSVFPLKGKDYYLGMPFHVVNFLRTALLDLKGVYPYGYWNNTDPEEGISEEDWELREKDWNEALSGSGVPADTSMTFTILPPYRILYSIRDYEELVERYS